MKKALILGTNAGQADIISYLKDNGWETHVCGYKKEGPGCELANEFHLVNTVDIEAVKKLATDIKTDIVYSVSSDSAITTATKVSEQLGLPTLLNSKIIDLFNSKNQFREFLNKNNIGTVKYITVNANNINDITDINWNIFPCVVKPTDSQGQRGVQLIYSKSELYEAVNLAIKSSSSKEAIVEEYLDGAEFSTNVIVQDGEILLNEFSDRIVFGNDFFGLPKGHGLPITYIDSEGLKVAEGYVKSIVEKLEIKDAVLYIQMKLSGNEPSIIEIAPRLDGCHIWRLIKHYRNIDLRELTIKCLLREKINMDSYNTSPSMSRSELMFYHISTNKKFSKEYLKLSKNPVYSEFRYNEGDSIVPINGKLEVVGYYIHDDI